MAAHKLDRFAIIDKICTVLRSLFLSVKPTQGSHHFENKYTDKMRKKTDKAEKNRQMMNIEILAEHSTLGPGPWTLRSKD
jgi:pentose-5-phosphate-3-epimerase